MIPAEGKREFQFYAWARLNIADEGPKEVYLRFLGERSFQIPLSSDSVFDRLKPVQ